jgi:cell division protein ZapA (FtsZ GTPase activity inhibitor)
MGMAEVIKRIHVRIGGMSYQLVSSENEAYTRQIALKADEMIRRVMQNNPQLTLGMSTVLALVNTLDELARVGGQMGALENQRQESDRQAADLRKELARMREQNWEMKKELLRVNSLLKEYEALLARSVPAATPDEKLAETAESAESAESAETVESAEPAESEDPDEKRQNRLEQTEIGEYLRENAWPPPYET